jgi:hypothetical protein
MKLARLSLIVAVACGLSATGAWAPAGAHEAHVHGVGKLDVALDSNTLTLHLDTPLVNLIGFEHEAKSAPDRQAAQKMSIQLRSAAAMFVTTPAAECKPASVTLVSAALAPALLGEAPAAMGKAARAKAGEHADLDGDFVFHCAHPERLEAIDVRLFDAFPGFHQIDVQAVTPKRQSAATLKPGATSIPF